MPGLPQEVNGLQLPLFVQLVNLQEIVAGNQLLFEQLDVCLEFLNFIILHQQLINFRLFEL